MILVGKSYSKKRKGREPASPVSSVPGARGREQEEQSLREGKKEVFYTRKKNKSKGKEKNVAWWSGHMSHEDWLAGWRRQFWAWSFSAQIFFITGHRRPWTLIPFPTLSRSFLLSLPRSSYYSLLFSVWLNYGCHCFQLLTHGISLSEGPLIERKFPRFLSLPEVKKLWTLISDVLSHKKIIRWKGFWTFNEMQQLKVLLFGSLERMQPLINSNLLSLSFYFSLALSLSLSLYYSLALWRIHSSSEKFFPYSTCISTCNLWFMLDCTRNIMAKWLNMMHDWNLRSKREKELESGRKN